MEETLVFIENNQTWLYVIFALLGFVFLRQVWQHYREAEGTYFSLERERARGRLIRSSILLGLAATGLAAVFVATTFASPSVPISARPTSIPTVSLLTTPDQQEGQGTEVAAATAIPEDSEAGCLNADATILSPSSGESITGVVEITGTANIPGFAFYKIEVRTLTPNSVWRAIGAGTAPVCENGCDEANLLGVWDTSLITAGEYQLQLVVMDTAGNAPMPCMIQVRVLPSS